MCVRHCNPSQDELAFSFYGRLRHKEPKDHTSEHTALYEELVKCLRWSTKPPKSIEITAAVRPCSPENESYLLWILSGSRRKQSSPRPWIDLSQIHSQDRKQRLSLNWLYKANSRKEEPNTQNTSQKCTGHPNPFKNHRRVGYLYSKWELKLSRGSPTPSLTFPTPMRITPGSCLWHVLALPVFWAAEWQQHSPRFPKQRERPTTVLRPCRCPEKMEDRWNLFHWQADACSIRVERDEMAEQSKFLSSPLIDLKILWRGRKLCPTPRACLPWIHTALLGTYWPWQCHRTSVCLKK